MAFSPILVHEGQISTSPTTTRESSPSPSLSPTPALSACPELDRSVSTASSEISTFSRQSTSRSSSASTTLRQRGYVRPQGVSFAPSAGNRDSVLSLGSIAHLQYYFARTGLLDGKGGQLARDDGKKKAGPEATRSRRTNKYILPDEDGLGDDAVEEAVLDDDSNADWDEDMMLPPTVSTYSHKLQHLPPPPDSETLRQDLKKTLVEAERALSEVEAYNKETLTRSKYENDESPGSEHGIESPQSDKSSGWHSIQGVHILDVMTSAIRAAKVYYTAHEAPQRLYSIKSERQIREELLGVMDTLKRMASRNFAGGTKNEEVITMQYWVKGIEAFVAEEQRQEKKEAESRQKWQWLGGSWEGRERERELLFINSFLADEALPEWTPQEEAEGRPTPFLKALQNGLTLVRLHNAILKKSKRQFGDIKTFHTDTGKPYRCAENLRYWVKAAELRWETKLRVDVTGVVHGKTDAWPSFDAAILQWSQAVRQEITQEWKEGSRRISSSVPERPFEEDTQQPL